jgi:FHA domain-containing protein
VEYNRRAGCWARQANDEGPGNVLLIRVVSFKGQPIGQELSAQFGEAGGTIGRGASNTLVLPDPERFISRTHATVSFQAGGFIITDNGTKNPVVLNGRPLGSGSQARLGEGDQVKVGDYLLQVAQAAASARPVPPVNAGAPRGGVPKDDPLAAFGGPPRGSDPFADLLPPADRVAPRPEPVRPVASREDPMRPPAGDMRLPDVLGDLRGREPSIDELFGLKSPSTSGLLSDPLPEPSASPSAAAGVVDPLDVLRGIVRSVPPPAVSDHAAELFTPYTPPAAKPDPALAPRAAPSPTPAAPGAAAATPSPPASTAPSGPPEAELLRAFLEGAGMQAAQLPSGLTPETMGAVGRILREAVQGTLDLLRARGLTKSEMRADVTMILPMDNNPLKFSPTVDAALVHMLGRAVPGFMSPTRAMQDAFDDLRAHQLGFLAGMRAALDELLARFEPEELENRLSAPSVLDSLLPMNRRAKLWDHFVERYVQVAGEAREDFNAAFGPAFVRAYEAQMKRLRAEVRRP